MPNFKPGVSQVQLTSLFHRPTALVSACVAWSQQKPKIHCSMRMTFPTV